MKNNSGNIAVSTAIKQILRFDRAGHSNGGNQADGAVTVGSPDKISGGVAGGIIGFAGVIVNFSRLSETKRKLTELQSNLENRKLNIKFEKASGETVEAVKQLAEELNAVTDALALYIKGSLNAVQLAENAFRETDENLAGALKK